MYAMSQDTLILLTRRFASIILDTQSVSNTILLLETYLKDFPSSNDMQKYIPINSLFFHRQWIRASIRGHMRKVSCAIKLLKQGKNSAAERELELATLWLGQAEKLYETITFFKNFVVDDLTDYTLQTSHLKKGDIILSYKTSYLLRRSFVSRLVKLASHSQITHIMIASHEENEEPELLFSGDDTQGLGVLVPKPKSGEIFLVMEAKDKMHQKMLNAPISKWRNHAYVRKKQSVDCYTFPELKCQIASLIGLVVVAMVYIGQPLSILNPIQKQSGVFCSELIDAIFKEAGILATPRSEHNGIVGPIEFFYSPLLTFKGVIASSYDLSQIQTEIREQFIGG